MHWYFLFALWNRNCRVTFSESLCWLLSRLIFFTAQNVKHCSVAVTGWRQSLVIVFTRILTLLLLSRKYVAYYWCFCFVRSIVVVREQVTRRTDGFYCTLVQNLPRNANTALTSADSSCLYVRNDDGQSFPPIRHVYLSVRPIARE